MNCCTPCSSDAPRVGEPHLLVVTPSPASIPVGESLQLTVDALDPFGGAATLGEIGWTSDDPAVVSVDAHGVATGVTMGSTTIRATASWKRAGDALLRTAQSRDVKVQATGPVDSVTIVPDVVTLTEGDGLYARAVVEDAIGNVIPDRAIAWASSNAAVATVSIGGEVVGLDKGTTTLTATVDGVAGTADIVVAGPLASVTITPDPIAFDDVTDAVEIVAVGKDADGTVIPGLHFTFSTDEPRTAYVTGSPVESHAYVRRGFLPGPAVISARTATAASGEVVGTVDVTYAKVTQFRYIVGDSLAALGATLSRNFGNAQYVDENGITLTAGAPQFRDNHHIGGQRVLLVEGPGPGGLATFGSPAQWERVDFPFYGTLAGTTMLYDIIMPYDITLPASAELSFGDVGNRWPGPLARFAGQEVGTTQLLLNSYVKPRDPNMGAGASTVNGHGFTNLPPKGTRLTYRVVNRILGADSHEIQTYLSINGAAELASIATTYTGNPDPVIDGVVGALVRLGCDADAGRPTNVGVRRLIIKSGEHSRDALLAIS